MNEYTIYIKSHTDWPDYEATAQANTFEEAQDIFYNLLHGEYSKEDIARYMEEN